MTKRLKLWRAKLSGKRAHPDDYNLDASDFMFCAIGERLGFPAYGAIKPYLTPKAFELGFAFYRETTNPGRLKILRAIEKLPKILKYRHPSDLVDTFLVKK